MQIVPKEKRKPLRINTDKDLLAVKKVEDQEQQPILGRNSISGSKTERI